MGRYRGMQAGIIITMLSHYVYLEDKGKGLNRVLPLSRPDLIKLLGFAISLCMVYRYALRIPPPLVGGISFNF